MRRSRSAWESLSAVSSHSSHLLLNATHSGFSGREKPRRVSVSSQTWLSPSPCRFSRGCGIQTKRIQRQQPLSCHSRVVEWPWVRTGTSGAGTKSSRSRWQFPTHHNEQTSWDVFNESRHEQWIKKGRVEVLKRENVKDLERGYGSMHKIREQWPMDIGKLLNGQRDVWQLAHEELDDELL